MDHPAILPFAAFKAGVIIVIVLRGFLRCWRKRDKQRVIVHQSFDDDKVVFHISP